MNIKSKLALYDKTYMTTALEGESASSTLQLGDIMLEEIAPGVACRKVFLEYQRLPGWVAENTNTQEESNTFDDLRLEDVLDWMRDPSYTSIDLKDFLFLDTETTGLSRGAGTIPFLCGLAQLNEKGVLFVQYFLSSLSGENEYLRQIGGFADNPLLVTFNGKSFDIPLLRNRSIVHRLGPLTNPTRHLDLLHTVRKFYKGASSYSQKSMEESLLNLRRHDDLPGAEIPQRYFDYIKYSESKGIEAVLKHNELDIFGMVSLFLHLLQNYKTKQSEKLQFGIARILGANHRIVEAIDLLESIEATGDAEKRFLAQLYERNLQVSQAIELYEDLAARECLISLNRLAILYERKQRNFERASFWAEKTLPLLERMDPIPKRSVDLLIRRINRLEKKRNQAKS